MLKITIEVPQDVVVTSRNVECAVDASKFDAVMWARLALHGLDQKVSDAASQAAGLAAQDKFGEKAKARDHKDWLQGKEGSAAVAAWTETLMVKAARGLEAGEWSQRGTGGAVSEETLVQRMVARNAMKAKLGGESEAWKEFLAEDKGAQATRLDGVWAKNAERLADNFATEMEIRKRRRATKAAAIEL